jgi:four helix bundle protein
MMPFDRLDAGKAGYALALAVYDATETFPKREWYGLAAQARRAAFSVPLNLAEGSAKRGAREFRRFVDIAIGSLSELEIALRLSRDRRMLTGAQWNELQKLSSMASKLTYRLSQALGRRSRQHQPSSRLAV